jgi:hypothetical protein
MGGYAFRRLSLPVTKLSYGIRRKLVFRVPSRKIISGGWWIRVVWEKIIIMVGG